MHTLLPTFNRFRGPEHILKYQHLSSCLSAHFYFQLLLSIFSRFYLFLTVFTYSLSNLPFFNRLYLFSTVFTQIRVLLHIITYIFISFLILLKLIFHYIWTIIVAHLVMLSGRVGSGWPWVGPGRAKTSGLALDPMWAGPGHEKSGPTLALPADSVVIMPMPVVRKRAPSLMKRGRSRAFNTTAALRQIRLVCYVRGEKESVWTDIPQGMHALINPPSPYL